MSKCLEKKTVNKPLRVHVEGSLCSGKSRFLDFLKKRSFIETHSEPLSAWQDLHSQNLFSLHYSDPEKYSFAFQSYVLLTLAERSCHTSDKSVQVYERSLESAQHVFIKALEKTQTIDQPMKYILEENIEFLNKHFNTEADFIIYIRTSPFTVADRIDNRGRSEERNISKDYLLLLHKLYEAWIKKQKKGRVFVINGELSYEEIEEEYKNCLFEIEQKLYDRELTGLLDDLTGLKIKSNN